MLPSICFPFKRRSWGMPSDPPITNSTTSSTTTTNSTDTDLGSPLRRLFRSKSDTDVKKSSYKMKGSSLSEMDVRRPRHRHNSTPPSSSSTPSSSSSSSSRRYRRVLRDVAPPSGDFSDDDNPNVVHKFSKEYLEKHNIDKASAASSTPAASATYSDQFGSRKDLPYEVSGSTILKRPLSVSESGAAVARTPANRPTISFGNEVEVIEFDKKEKVKARSSCMRRVQLSMDEDVKHGVEDNDDTEGDDAEKENSCRSGDTSSPRDERVLEQWE